MVIRKGDEVLLHYDMMLENGKVIESTRRRVPFCLHVGSNVMPTGFEEKLVGLKKGDKKKFSLPAGKLFGERKENLSMEISKDSFVDDHELSVGKVVEVFGKDGEVYMASVLEVKEQSVLVDTNHPLAGLSLLFDVEIVDVYPAEKSKVTPKKKVKSKKKVRVKAKKKR
jgi:FKBP-type peptidyl-prolyl cis-trans isomerase 2